MSNANELLKRALEALELMYFCHADQKWISYGQQKEKIHQQAIAEINDIRAFLAAEPEAEDPKDRDDPNVPSAWIDWDEDGYAFITIEGSGVPVYLHPPRPEPARKPMTEEEAIELCPFTREEFKAGFLTGIRFAEKHQGVGGDDE